MGTYKFYYNQVKNKIKNVVKDYTTDELLFCSLLFLSFFIFVIVNFVTHGMFYNRVFYYGTDTFMDFINSIYDVYKADPYEHGSIYPPFCHIVYYLFVATIPAEAFNSSWYTFPGGRSIIERQETQLMVLLYCILTMLFFYFSLKKYIQHNLGNKKVLAFAFLFSTPFLYVVERGNILLLCICFLIMFFLLKDSKNRIFKNIALIMLAIAINIKIYPVFFTLILLKEKRFRDFFKVCFASAAILIIPFIFLGGIRGMWQFVNNLFNNVDLYSNNTYGDMIDYNHILLYGGEILKKPLENNTTKTISLFIFVVLLLCFVLQKVKWKGYLCIFLIVACIPTFSGKYNVCYFILPFIMLLAEERRKGINSIYYFLMLLLFLNYPFGGYNIVPYVETLIPVNFSSFISMIVVSLLGIILLLDTILQYQFAILYKRINI